MPTVSKETFKEYSVSNKLNTLFDHIASIPEDTAQAMATQAATCEKRFTKLESSKKYNLPFTAIFGVFGGFLAICTKWLMID